MDEMVLDIYQTVLVPIIRPDLVKRTIDKIYTTFSQEEDIIFSDNMWKPYHYRIDYDAGKIVEIGMEEFWKA